ncbi:uncharacterized protein N7482_008727 [Penicillium canariense]|uniref:Uncharacterized protein n=1 Tax=Penicillium canariense TaxID=189055 RepID=A0A9W9HWD5_9EURO|nr:uncharacterized protein N7482_008727 [Penicillium canariense]KAJ5157627.1 hypothetical protein N7482_008727 [Penicillium canariense]
MEYLIKQYTREQSKSEIFTFEDYMLSRKIQTWHNWGQPCKERISLRRALLARLELNRKANMYAGALGLHRLPDIEEWDPLQTEELYDMDIERLRWSARIIIESGLFEKKGNVRHSYIPYYHKPSRYLAAEMLLAVYDEVDVENAAGELGRMQRDGQFSWYRRVFH